MKALRLILTQSQAHYRRPETVQNRMTYTLPPFSTVIGAIHKACGYKEYHPIDLSIQGNYGAMKKEMFRSMTVLNRVEPDRGTLAWMPEGTISNAYVKIGKAIARGADFRMRKNVTIYNEDEYQKWIALRDKTKQATELKKVADEKLKQFKRAQKAAGKKVSDYKNSPEYCDLVEKVEEAKRMKEKLKLQSEQYRTVEFIPTYQELLFDIKLIIHLHGDDALLQDIYAHRYDIKAIGRSEDFINLESADFVELDHDNIDAVSEYLAYIHATDNFSFADGRPLMGTKYLLPKKYTFVDDKRVFENVPAMEVSGYKIKQFSESVWRDPDGYLVNFA